MKMSIIISQKTPKNKRTKAKRLSSCACTLPQQNIPPGPPQPPDYSNLGNGGGGGGGGKRRGWGSGWCGWGEGFRNPAEIDSAKK